MNNGFSGWVVFSAVFVFLAGISGCGQSGETPNTEVADSIPLYVPDEVPSTKLYVYPGQLIEIQWSTEVTSNGLKLTCFNRATSVGTDITTNGTGGKHNWRISGDMVADTDYEIRAFEVGTNGSLADSEAEPILKSARIRLTGVPDDIDSNSIPVACNSNGECNDELFCNGAEVCTHGFCTNGVSPCAADQSCDEATDTCSGGACESNEDCGLQGFCIDDVCTIIEVGSNALQGYALYASDDSLVDFSQPLVVGDVLSITAPPIAEASLSVWARVISADCSCSWTIEPTSAGTFDTPESCAANLTLAEKGSVFISVETECDGVEKTYIQQGTIVDAPPPTTCENVDDCQDGEICEDGVCVTPPAPAPSITVLEEELIVPYVVRLYMRLIDADDDVIPSGVTSDQFAIYENNVKLDLTETNQFITPGANLPLRIMLVLDYTNSMDTASAISPMIDAARSFVEQEHFTASHQIGIIEFHDRGGEDEGFSVAVELTDADSEGKTAIKAGIPSANSLEPGLTRVWDAINLAMVRLAVTERKTGEVQAIVFLTDGRDTTSELDADAIASAAVTNEINLYPIGFGDVADNESVLESLADQTGGAYFPASDAAELQDILTKVASDLRGQWNLCYVTQRNSGSVDLKVEFTWESQTAEYESNFDAGQLAGDIHQGIIEVVDRDYDAFMDRTRFLLRATYIPRSINRLDLVFAHSSAVFELQGAGGLMNPADGWSLTDMGDGEYLIFGFDLLEYGAFGNIGTVTIPGNIDYLQVQHDDTVFDFLPQDKTFVFTGDLWAKPYTLTAEVGPATELGNITITPDKTGYGHGETVTLTATPVGTSTFEKWTGDSDSTDAGITLTMDEDKTVTAVFKE